MANISIDDQVPTEVAESSSAVETSVLAVDDLLVEDVSIDGMCGVY